MDFNMSTDGGSNFNVSKTTTAGYSYNDEAGTSTEYGHNTSKTKSNETGNQFLLGALGNDNDVSIKDLKSKFSQNTQLLPPGAEGSIFEAAINLGLLTTKTSTKAKTRAFDQSTEGAQKPFDFEEVGPAKPDFKSIFGFKVCS